MHGFDGGWPSVFYIFGNYRNILKSSMLVSNIFKISVHGNIFGLTLSKSFEQTNCNATCA